MFIGRTGWNWDTNNYCTDSLNYFQQVTWHSIMWTQFLLKHWGWFNGASAPFTRIGMFERDVPSQNLKILYFWNPQIVQYGEYFKRKFRSGDDLKKKQKT